MPMNPYANNKILYHIDRLRQIKEGKSVTPVHLYVYPSDLCNHNCGFCAYRTEGYTTSQCFPDGEEKNPDRMIGLPKMIEILGDAAEMGVRAVQFSGGGEPTMNPDFADMLRVAHALRLQTGVVTNGVRMIRHVRTALLDSEWVRISLDAATEGTYAKSRGLRSGQDMGTTLANIDRLIEERNAESGSGPYVGLSFVVTRDNWQEIPKMVELAEVLGVDNLRFAAVFTNDGRDYYGDIYDGASALCRTAGELKWVSNSFGERCEDLATGHPEYQRCVQQHVSTLIGGDLNLYACCLISYNTRGLIGSLKKDRLINLWNSRQKWDFMDNFDARGCPRCQFNVRNRQANALIEELPDLHEEFI